ncbi:hypothetical protein [uncultured Helicobacter sp.]
MCFDIFVCGDFRFLVAGLSHKLCVIKSGESSAPLRTYTTESKKRFYNA